MAEKVPEISRDSLDELTEKDIAGAILNEPLENATVPELMVATLPWHSGFFVEKNETD